MLHFRSINRHFNVGISITSTIISAKALIMMASFLSVCRDGTTSVLQLLRELIRPYMVLIREFISIRYELTCLLRYLIVTNKITEVFYVRSHFCRISLSKG